MVAAMTAREFDNEIAFQGWGHGRNMWSLERYKFDSPMFPQEQSMRVMCMYARAC